jgi:hypothetical protein
MSYAAYDVPGVFGRIIDATQFVEVTTPLTLGMVGTASKGPLEIPTTVTSIAEFFRLFGPPVLDSYSYYAADAYFAHGSHMIFTRVESAATPAAFATYDVDSSLADPVLTAISEGTWAHDIDIYIVEGSGGAAFIRLDVYYLGDLVESYDNIDDVDPDFAAALNGVSEFLTAVNGGAGTNVVVPQNGTLAGGDDGTTGAVDADYIGSITAGVRTGWQHYRNRRQYPLQLIACPDWPDQQVADEMLNIAYERGDCIALIDAPDGQAPTAAGINTWITGLSPATDEESFGAIIYPWLEVWDAKNNQSVWTPTSGHFAGAIAYNDHTRGPWYAPAGINRGRLIRATDIRLQLSTDDIRTIYTNGNVNPIVVNNGINIEGHKTLQTADTALKYIEVRRALLALRLNAEKAGRKVQFKPNDDKTYRELSGIMDGVVAAMLSSEVRAFRELRFRCDSKLNPDRTKRKHEIHAQFYCKPNIGIETIILDLVLTAAGMAFSESLLA